MGYFETMRALWEGADSINTDAIFIADAHFIPPQDTPALDSVANSMADSASNSIADSMLDCAPDSIQNTQSNKAAKALLSLLQNLLDNPKNTPSQVFLMGDIAHLLLGGVNTSIKYNHTLLALIESISQRTQVWWFEGNHDFGLCALSGAYAHYLKHVKIIPRTQQPLPFIYMHNNTQKRVLLAHGDIFLNTKYELYIRLMNASFTRFVLHMLDSVTFGNLYRYVVKKVNHNVIKEGKVAIAPFAQRRISAYKAFVQKYTHNAYDVPNMVDMIIEGHFHIGKTYNHNDTLYISLPSFYLSRSIFGIESALTK